MLRILLLAVIALGFSFDDTSSTEEASTSSSTEEPATTVAPCPAGQCCNKKGDAFCEGFADYCEGEDNQNVRENCAKTCKAGACGPKVCRPCDCSKWDGSNYSNCRPVTLEHKCGSYCVQCQRDGITPMPGLYTTHKKECEKYTKYVKITSGTCEDAGKDSVQSDDDCKEALENLGLKETWNKEMGSKSMYNGCFTATGSGKSYFVYDKRSSKYAMSDPKSKVTAGSTPRKAASADFTYYCYAESEDTEVGDMLWEDCVMSYSGNIDDINSKDKYGAKKNGWCVTKYGSMKCSSNGVLCCDSLPSTSGGSYHCVGAEIEEAVAGETEPATCEDDEAKAKEDSYDPNATCEYLITQYKQWGIDLCAPDSTFKTTCCATCALQAAEEEAVGKPKPDCDPCEKKNAEGVCTRIEGCITRDEIEALPMDKKDCVMSYSGNIDYINSKDKYGVEKSGWCVTEYGSMKCSSNGALCCDSTPSTSGGSYHCTGAEIEEAVAGACAGKSNTWGPDTCNEATDCFSGVYMRFCEKTCCEKNSGCEFPICEACASVLDVNNHRQCDWVEGKCKAIAEGTSWRDLAITSAYDCPKQATFNSVAPSSTPMIVNVFAAVGMAALLYGSFRHYTQK